MQGSLSLVLPCFNEEENVATTVRACDAWIRSASIDGEIIAVDDGSRDGTGRVLDGLKAGHPNLVVLTHPENRGYGAALRTGLNVARKEIIGFMDSDGQFDPKDIALLLPALDGCDFVTGRRRTRADPIIRKVNAKLFGFLVWAILGMWIRDINGGMKMMRRSIWARIRPAHSTGALFNAEVFWNLRRQGIAWAQVAIPHYPRKFGVQTGAKPTVIFRMFKELWALRRSGKK